MDASGEQVMAVVNTHATSAESLPKNGSRIQRRIVYTEEQWESVRHTVRSLYVDQDRTLVETMWILGSQHNFHAGERKLRQKLDEWRFRKYVPKGTMKAIAAVAHKRKLEEGKETVAQVHGMEIGHERLATFKKRKFVREGTPVDIPEEGIADVICSTPPSPAVNTLEANWGEELLGLANIRRDLEKMSQTILGYEHHFSAALGALVSPKQSMSSIEVVHRRVHDMYQERLGPLYWITAFAQSHFHLALESLGAMKTAISLAQQLVLELESQLQDSQDTVMDEAYFAHQLNIQGGMHRRAGEPHASEEALSDAVRRGRGASGCEYPRPDDVAIILW